MAVVESPALELESPSREETALRQLADQAFSRAAGAPLVAGNAVAILRDARENFPAWLAAIRGAKRSVFVETYIFSDDVVGRDFIAALAERARAGVVVRVVYDWFGTRRARSLFRPLVDAGGEVHCFNPPRLDSPFGWMTRDHRKLIAVDGEVGFVSGLCLSAKWLGDPTRHIDPWRDTGIELRGPAVPELERAFSQVWQAATGAPLPENELTPAETVAVAGDIALRVIASVPSGAGLFRVDQLVAAVARERLWLTDAYFVGVTPYVRALCAAAHDGVDVRLLVPGASDIPWISRLSRAGYRPLLESGVRVFEWKGSMLHAKTAVADDSWARVGSTNLNFASFVTNYELDVAIEDRAVVRTMAGMYEEDLERATEIVLSRRLRSRPIPAARTPDHVRRALPGSAGRAAAGAVSVGAALGAALTRRRLLGPAEASLLARAGAILLAIAAVGIFWPRVLAWPFAVVTAWVAVVLLFRARSLWLAARPEKRRRGVSRRAVASRRRSS